MFSSRRYRLHESISTGTAFTKQLSSPFYSDSRGHKATSNWATSFLPSGIHMDFSVAELFSWPGKYVTVFNIRLAVAFTFSGRDSLSLFHHHSSNTSIFFRARIKDH